MLLYFNTNEEGDCVIIDYNSGIIEAILDKSNKILVNNIHFSIKENETLVLIGETGSGKTIVACSILKLLPDNVIIKDSHIVFNGINISEIKNMKQYLGKDIVYIPQSGLECLNPSKTVRSQMIDSLKINHIKKDKWDETCKELLQKVGLTNYDSVLNKYPFELSGGMAQKITIALASCSNPKLIIADEPTNGLDNEAKQNIIKLITDLFPDSAKLLITHDISLAKYADRLMVLNNGVMMEEGTTNEVINNPKHPYTMALINSLVENNLQETPKLRNGKALCPFYKKCPRATDDCLSKVTLHEKNSRKWNCIYD